MKKIYFAPQTEISSVEAENTCINTTSPYVDIDLTKGTEEMHAKEIATKEESWGNLW